MHVGLIRSLQSVKLTEMFEGEYYAPINDMPHPWDGEYLGLICAPWVGRGGGKSIKYFRGQNSTSARCNDFTTPRDGGGANGGGNH